jgi:hypothetical protein
MKQRNHPHSLDTFVGLWRGDIGKVVVICPTVEQQQEQQQHSNRKTFIRVSLTEEWKNNNNLYRSTKTTTKQQQQQQQQQRRRQQFSRRGLAFVFHSRHSPVAVDLARLSAHSLRISSIVSRS